ncbi:Endonuclease/exonuclease/phosphatase [Corchorus capsularis]|uniref:Endonuclease/exonuclease/phosphatase n=1 Tax=Corchorus capsularis TaxID=210143 RepID=A0A1R3JYT7_COCAP|nr:Endonuclease/exonuclease/phosphatase [Corchorus capsularis]
MGAEDYWETVPPAVAPLNLEREEHWRRFDNSVNAVSFGFVATAILISMFLVMAIFERFLRPRSSLSSNARNHADVESHSTFNGKLNYPSPKRGNEWAWQHDCDSSFAFLYVLSVVYSTDKFYLCAVIYHLIALLLGYLQLRLFSMYNIIWLLEPLDLWEKMTIYANGVSVLMPGEETPTFIAHPAPAPCPPERVLKPLHQQNQIIGRFDLTHNNVGQSYNNPIYVIDRFDMGHIKGRFPGACSNAAGSAGGLISIWNDDFFSLDSSIVKDRFILLIGTLKGANLKCILVNLYAPNDDSERKILFQELVEIISPLNLPCCIGGVFNVVRSPEEKIRVTLNSIALSDFSDFIENLNFADLPLEGEKYTWCSKRENPSFSRLDRFLLTSDYLERYPLISQKDLPRSLSDHNPVILFVDDKNWGPKPFRFFNHWLFEKGFQNVVVDSWNKSSSSDNLDLWGKLRNTKTVLRQWYRNNLGGDC